MSATTRAAKGAIIARPGGAPQSSLDGDSKGGTLCSVMVPPIAVATASDQALKTGSNGIHVRLCEGAMSRIDANTEMGAPNKP